VAPRAGRYAAEAAVVLLVALGAALVGLAAAAVVALALLTSALVVVLERAYAGEAARVEGGEVEELSGEPVAAPVPAPEPDPEPELAVSRRSARAILATGPPPAEPRVAEPAREPEPERAPEPPPEPVPEPLVAAQEREWSVWALQRIVRDHPEDPRHQEWTALVLSLREFARADGTLPVEFDALVREAFGRLLEAEHATAAAT
jgi:outer membrane biosynthesis protein TonB